MVRVTVTAKSYIRIGTRGSLLAMAQAHEVAQALIEQGYDSEIVPIVTTGDRLKNARLADIGGKALFIKELEEALLSGTIDLAVHSMKDVETLLNPQFIIPCILKRQDAREALITQTGCLFPDLVHGAVLGTSSVRRAAQARCLRPDLQVIPFRGNVDTRLRKLKEGQADLTFLALAGLKRLQQMAAITEIIAVDVMTPAAGQGAIGVECCRNNNDMLAILEKINHLSSYQCVMAERALLAGLQGSCTTPVGVYAEWLSSYDMQITAIVMTPDGQFNKRYTITDSWPHIKDNAHFKGQECREWLLQYAPQTLSC